MKVSKRINALVNLIKTESYERILDTCCDHGLIGLAMLQEQSISLNEMTFIDIVKPIIDKLKIDSTYIPKNSKTKITTEVQCVKKIQFSNEDLVIMAGVGADLIIDAITEHKKNSLSPKHYLISAHTKHTWLREELKTHGLFVLKEHLIKEDHIYYDHMLVSYERGEEILDFNRTGSHADLQSYYLKLQSLFELKAKNGDIWSDKKLRNLLFLK